MPYHVALRTKNPAEFTFPWVFVIRPKVSTGGYDPWRTSISAMEQWCLDQFGEPFSEDSCDPPIWEARNHWPTATFRFSNQTAATAFRVRWG